MKTPSEIITDFIESLSRNPKVDQRVYQMLKKLNEEGKLNQKNLKEAIDELIEDGAK